MDKYKHELAILSEMVGVSGYEGEISCHLSSSFKKYTDSIKMDKLGNLIALKKGTEQENPVKVMLAAHMDEIGLMVTDIEKGFLRVTPVGGIDPRTMISQEVVIHSRGGNIAGIIGAFSPFFADKENLSKGVQMKKLFVDTGLAEKELLQRVRVGDLITVARKFCQLVGETVAGKAIDDRAGIVAMQICLEELAGLYHKCDVYAVATVQEEVDMGGALVSTYGVRPDIGIAVDVTHGDLPGVPEYKTFPLGKGVVLARGPNIHPAIYDKLKKTAEKYGIPYQQEIEPLPTGTDARAMQITREGVATGLVSLPLRYMHTSVETLNVKDIVTAGRLLAFFVRDLDASFREELTCF